jgi:hypothetical protein
MIFLFVSCTSPSLKASEERQILSPTEVKKRRKRHETQTCVEICVLLDLLWLANRRGAAELLQKSAAQKSAAGVPLQKSDAAFKPSSADASAASTTESTHAFAWSLNFAGRLPSPASSSTTTGAGGEKSTTAVGKTSWRQAAAAAIEAKKNAASAAAASAASANATSDGEPDSASASSRFALIAPTAADACGARVLLALLRVTDAFQVRAQPLCLRTVSF